MLKSCMGTRTRSSFTFLGDRRWRLRALLSLAVCPGVAHPSSLSEYSNKKLLQASAFKIGAAIADFITGQNPWPVRLQFEKVYVGCFMIAKKRYVGYSFESESQTVPVFDAKGIETVRRDTCPAVAKLLESSIRRMFESYDVSQVSK